MSLKLAHPLISVDELHTHLADKNLIVLDCTIPKVTSNSKVLVEATQIQNAVFFDLKNNFSDKDSIFPNTMLSPKEFEEKAQLLGISSTSKLVVYDALGIYSSARVWWMFQLMGFHNIAVLDGGLPAWLSKGYPVEKPQVNSRTKGDFKANYQPEKITFTKAVLAATNNTSILIADARSKGRFLGTTPEPRKDLKSGHIPNSVSMPFALLQENGKMKDRTELRQLFLAINPQEKELILSCGSGITASILALGAEICDVKNYAVYDGSWTEWASTEGLPIAL